MPERRRIIIRDRLLDRIVRNAAVILSGNLASSALGFISFAVMANSLGPELLAYFALSQVYALIVNDLFNVQTWESLIKFGTKLDGEEKLGKTIKTNCFIDLVSASFAFLVALLVVAKVGSMLHWEEELIDLAFWYSFTIPFTFTTLTIGIPRLFNKFAVIAKIQFAVAVLKLILIASFNYQGFGVKAFTGVYIGIDILLNSSLIGYSLYILKRESILDWRRTKMYLTQEQIKFLWWTNLRTIVRIPVRKLDILILNQAMSMDTVGVYKAYKEIVGIIGRLGEPINQALYPEYAKMLGQDKAVDTLRVTKRIIQILASVAVVVLAFFLISSSWILDTLFGPEYLIYIHAFYILVVLNCISLFLTPVNSLFIAAGFAKSSFYIVLFNNILYLIVALVGGVYFGIYGVILAFAVQMLFNQGLKIVLLRRHPTGWGTVIR